MKVSDKSTFIRKNLKASLVQTSTEQINYSSVFNDSDVELLTVRNNESEWALYHDRLVLCLPENGLKSQWIVEGQTIDLDSRSVGIIHPGSFHRTTWASPKGDFSALFIDRKRIENIAFEKFDFNKFKKKTGNISRSPNARRLLEQIICQSRSSEDELEFESKLLSLTHLITGSEYTSSSTSADNVLMKKAKDYIIERSQDKIQLSDIARNCGVESFYLLHNFSKHFGESPYRFRNRVRTERARQLLREKPLSVAEVAYECGFSDQSHLIRWFKRLFKETPEKYRQSLTSSS